MKRFAALYSELDGTTKTTEKVAALVRYFRETDPADAAWAVYFLTGRKPKQVVPAKQLRQWAAEAAAVPDWLFEECYHAVADLAETAALLVPAGAVTQDLPLHRWVVEKLLPLRTLPEDDRKRELLNAWAGFDTPQRFVWNKLITGAFRVGVSQQLVVKALAEVGACEPAAVSHRMMGDWQPTAHYYLQLIAQDIQDADPSRPYPFFLASPLDGPPAELGDIGDWQAEWKWDGIRAQLIRRGGQTFLWSRGEELVTDRYPEVRAAGDALPDGTVLDGELLPWSDGAARPFADLQKRIGRKTVSKKLLQEIPVRMVAYDLLEFAGEDWRERPLHERRTQMEGVIFNVNNIIPSEVVFADSWDVLAVLRESSRSRGVEGFMLKKRDSSYRTGRVRGDWWKWKIEPLSADAVLVYAQRGSGKRASLYTDYTFAIWKDGQLVPFAKAYSGLTDAEIREVDKFIRAHTVESFGPVRTVKPELVFEIGFEGISRSTRHKSGIAVRFPRILRARPDKSPAEADTLERLQALLPRS
jgi:DNA ligase 1